MRATITTLRWAPAGLLALLAAGAISGCGSSSAAAPPSPPRQAPQSAAPAASDTPLPTPQAIDACTLLTLADASAFGGVQMLPGQAGIATEPSCTYNSPPTGKTVQLEIHVGDGAKKFLDIDRDALKHSFTAVTGVADEAWQEDGAIFFRKGTTWVSLSAVTIDLDPATVPAQMVQLARTVAGRLGA